MNPRLTPTVLLFTLLLAPLAGTASAAPAERAAKARECEELRMKYAASDAYRPDDDVVADLHTQCSEQMLNKDYAKAIELAERGLKRNPYHIQLLMLQAAAYRASGNEAKADEIRTLWFGLMDSILDSGDGLSYGNAFRVISIEEEDAVLRALQLTSTEKRSVERRGHQYDVLAAEDTKNRQRRDVYFNTDLLRKWQARQAALRAAGARPAAKP